jgi:hypothetical protein
MSLGNLQINKTKVYTGAYTHVDQNFVQFQSWLKERLQDEMVVTKKHDHSTNNDGNI